MNLTGKKRREGARRLRVAAFVRWFGSAVLYTSIYFCVLYFIKTAL